MKVEHLVLKRDIYYIAKKAAGRSLRRDADYDFPGSVGRRKVADFFADPRPLDARQPVLLAAERRVPLEADQFFALGDNSPQSKDSRLWADGEHPNIYVRRELLIGQALFIYWPASHNQIPYVNIPFPLFPNFKDMGFIR